MNKLLKLKKLFLKKINNKPQYNTMNNSVYNNTISTKKNFLSLEKKDN